METERSSSWIKKKKKKKKKKKVRVFLHFGEEMRENVPSSLDDVSVCADSFCRASSRKMISSSMFVVVVVVFVLFFFFVLLSLLMCYRSSFFFFFLLFNFYMGSLIGCYFFRLVDIFFSLLTVFLSLSLFTHTHFCTTGLSLSKKKKKVPVCFVLTKKLFLLGEVKNCIYSRRANSK